MPNSEKMSVSPGYELFMLVLCLYALGVLAAQTAVGFEPQTQAILDYGDDAVCAVFFADFAYSLFRAPNRWRYMATWGWLDLLSSFPTLDVARWGRAARILRICRVLRGLRATRVLASLVFRRRTENTFLAASLIAILLIIFCSIAVLDFESGSGSESNIRTAEDAIWWSFATITTVGYGDCYPVSTEGRFVAVVLMCAGVGLFGTFSGFLAAWFIGSGSIASASGKEGELAALQREVVELRRLLEGMAATAPDHLPKTMEGQDTRERASPPGV
jgi:voltage-gated potassium channel